MLPLHISKKLAYHSTDRGFTTKVAMLENHRDYVFIRSCLVYYNGSNIRYYLVAAVEPGDSPFVVNGLARPQHDDSMSTCVHMRCRSRVLDANEAGSLSRVVEIADPSVNDVGTTPQEFGMAILTIPIAYHQHGDHYAGIEGREAQRI